jgi:nucleoside-diphosphate-sugar epimerase
MRVLITGAGGNLGSGLVERLADDYDLRLLDVDELETEHEFVQADVRDRDRFVEAARGVDVIVHTPAWHGIHLGSRDEDEFWDLNVDGTFNAFRAALASDVSTVVWLSSQAIHSPDNIYGFSKVLGEKLGRYYNRVHGIRCIMLRPANFVPPQNRRHYGQRLLRGGVDRRDVLQATTLAVENDTVECEAVPVLREDPFTDADVETWTSNPYAVLERYVPEAKRLVEEYDLDLPDQIDPPDVTATKEALGYHPQYTFITFLRDLAEQDAEGSADSWLAEPRRQ